MNCRCGYTGEGDHPCHWGLYTCKRPAKHRLYNAKPAALAGVQMKLVASETWACDEHWEEWKREYE